MKQQLRSAGSVGKGGAAALIRFRRSKLVAVGLLSCFMLLPGCGGTPSSPSNESNSGSDTTLSNAPLSVVAAENVWGSIASQVGGDKVKVTSIVANPNTDPHDYEPKPADARLMASARYVILNGAGYDAWGQKLLDANPVSDRKTLIIGDLVGKKAGDNPHLWYSPDYVMRVVEQMTADFKALDPANAAYYDQEKQQFISTELKDYTNTLSAIQQKYAGTAVGSTESIFAYLAEALGLKLLTPPQFMNAISEGEEPTAADKTTFDQQIRQKQIQVLVANAQNSTPDTDALQQKAQTAGIPVVAVTETLPPGETSFQAWQTAQLKALQAALAKATGR
ncbi:MAG TPA: zinc ABC transporter substrate-binding protein [Coleofasciculaceae cyanobacterium]